MSKKSRGWTRQQRKRIRRKEHAGRMRARMRRQENDRRRAFAKNVERWQEFIRVGIRNGEIAGLTES